MKGKVEKDQGADCLPAEVRDTPAVACGFPSPAEQFAAHPLDLNGLLLRHPAASYFLRAAGDSMSGAHIQPDDILVVDRARTPEDGDIVVACIDNEFTMKFFRREASGAILLEAANPAYPALRFSGEQEVRCFGVVTACIHRFRK